MSPTVTRLSSPPSGHKCCFPPHSGHKKELCQEGALICTLGWVPRAGATVRESCAVRLSSAGLSG